MACQALKHCPVPLAIIGGGAAGLFAAASASARKLGCLVFERKARVGAKMLMTANGRCNFTKDVSVDEMLSDIGEPVAGFVRPALEACPPQMVVNGFKARGLRVKRMTDRRMFPASEKAADVVHVFGDLLRDKAIPLLTNCPVTGLKAMKNGFLVATANFTVWAERVLVATGGLSFPKTGSVGDGQRLAVEAGHRLEPCRAALVGVDTRERAVLSLAGTRYERATAAVVVNGAEVFRAEGEVEFEPTGLSGAAVYNCTRHAARQNLRQWDLAITTPKARHFVPRPAVRPLKEAIVTLGGVARDEVNPLTMESRLVPGLYFAGEVLDIDGPTGGYNLTLAFATARLAVESAYLARKGGA